EREGDVASRHRALVAPLVDARQAESRCLLRGRLRGLRARGRIRVVWRLAGHDGGDERRRKKSEAGGKMPRRLRPSGDHGAGTAIGIPKPVAWVAIVFPERTGITSGLNRPVIGGKSVSNWIR